MDVSAITDFKVYVHATQANCVHLTIELGDKLASSLHITVGAIMPHMDILAENSSVDFVVTTGWFQANTDDFLTHIRPFSVVSFIKSMGSLNYSFQPLLKITVFSTQPASSSHPQPQLLQITK
ncbi:MAG: hypothetical protein WBC02_10420 [Candidatus Aminicenantaceae bacterium]